MQSGPGKRGAGAREKARGKGELEEGRKMEESPLFLT
jgi:hypothetical protein